MKNAIISIILLILSSNLLVESRTLFHEDYPFHAQFVTEVCVSKTSKTQLIQAIFPSPYNEKIPVIIDGEARYNEIDNKPYVQLTFDKLSLSAKKYIPVKIQINSVDGLNILNGMFPTKSPYQKSLIARKKYAKDFLMFPINRYKYNPTVSKPTKNTFIMLLEPFYAIGSGVLYLTAPFVAPLYIRPGNCDIPKGSIFEFEFLQELNLTDFDTAKDTL